PVSPCLLPTRCAVSPFSSHSSLPHRDLPSFPTRRSSDLLRFITRVISIHSSTWDHDTKNQQKTKYHRKIFLIPEHNVHPFIFLIQLLPLYTVFPATSL